MNMTTLDSAAAWSWPEVILTLGLIAAGLFVLTLVLVAVFGRRDDKVKAAQSSDARQLAERYEELTALSLDAQQRIAADLTEVRARIAAIESLLRTVD